MTDFFTALETELHAAAVRRPRRAVGAGQALGALAALGLLAAAALIVVAVGGGGGGGGGRAGRLAARRGPDPVGTVIPRSETDLESPALVVANGDAPGFGPWQIEVSRTKGERDTSGEVMWPRGYCLWIHRFGGDPMQHGRSGFCGAPRSLGFRKTPGFSRAQTPTTSKPPPTETLLVWGRVPDRAARVVITAPGRKRIEVVPEPGPKRFPGQYYAIPVKPGRPGARIDWLDRNGNP